MTASRIATLLSVTSACFAQALLSTQTAHNASCSNTQITAGGNVTFSCSGLTPEQAKLLNDLPALLNRAFDKEQANLSQISNRLDGCLEGISELKEGYWPMLDDNQTQRITSAIKPFPPTTADIDLWNGSEDHDRGKLAIQLKKALVAAGWSVNTNYPSVMFGPNSSQPRGVVIEVLKDSPTVQALGGALKKVLGSENVNGQFRTGTFSNPAATIAISIWPRP